MRSTGRALPAAQRYFYKGDDVPTAIRCGGGTLAGDRGAGAGALGARREPRPLLGDLSIAHRIQDARSPAKTIADATRTITSTEVVLATGAAIVLVLWLRGYRRQAVLLVGGLVAFAVVEVVAKDFVDRPRPDPSLVVRRATYDSAGSFPSGHVISATFLYGYLLYLSFRLDITRSARWALGVVSTLIVVLSGPINVYLGVHWPSDVLGAWLWALAVLVPVFAADLFVEEHWPGFPCWPRWRD